MSGSGARDGGSPPWGPADPVPDFTDTQAMPGLGGMRRPAADGPVPGGHHARKGRPGQQSDRNAIQRDFRGDALQLRQNGAERGRRGIGSAEREVEDAVVREEALIDGYRFGLRQKCAVR